MSVEAIRLRFPARSEYLVLARLAVAGVARRMALGRNEVADLKLAVTEACSNAMRHGYAGSTGGEIELELVVAHDRLEVVVEDHGAGIALPVPEGPSELGGMGLPIMRAVMDELEIRSTDDGTGTVVHMTKLAQDARENSSPIGRCEIGGLRRAGRGYAPDGRARSRGDGDGGQRLPTGGGSPTAGTAVITVHGDLDLHSADELGDLLVGVIDRGASMLVVDLSDVEFVDSQGLGALLRGTRRLGAGKDRFRLVVPAPEIRRVFQITALDQIFPLDESRELAIAHGFPRRYAPSDRPELG